MSGPPVGVVAIRCAQQLGQPVVRPRDFLENGSEEIVAPAPRILDGVGCAGQKIAEQAYFGSPDGPALANRRLVPSLHTDDQVCPLDVVFTKPMSLVIGKLHAELEPNPKGARLGGIAVPGP